MFLHKVGKYEIPASEILTALQISHISYEISRKEDISLYLSKERSEWIESVGEKMVCSELFTSEETSLVTFEEFKIFCDVLWIECISGSKKDRQGVLFEDADCRLYSE